MAELINTAKKDTVARDSLLKFTPPANTNQNAAAKWERDGFTALFKKDIDGAINAFNSAQQSQNGYRMVYEIGRHLSHNGTTS